MQNITNPQPLLLRYAFRPLFLLAAVQALVMMTLWGLWWGGLLPLTLPTTPQYWHGHEMLNGLGAAAIGGFLLTAVATWTRRAPVQGLPLVLLCLLWLGGRLSLLWPSLAAACDVLYWTWLLALMANEVLRSGNRRNYKILLVLLLFLVTDLGFHVAAALTPSALRSWLWAQLWLVLVLINLVGGRIIPAFTRNWLLRQQPDAPAPAEFGRVDIAATLALLLFAASTVLPAAWSLPALVPLVLGLAAAILQAWRLGRWQGHRSGSEPLLWMLHLGYAWIPVGCLLLALAYAGLVPQSAGVHALTVGAIATLIMAVSSRAALGHTGRELQSHPLLTLAVLILNLATLARILASLVDSNALVEWATLLWLLAFVLYAAANAPVLLRA